jgi:ABC-type transport system substrate-binding protein
MTVTTCAARAEANGTFHFTKRQITLALGTAAAVGLLLCGSVQAAETPKRGGVLRIGHSTQVQGFDPFTISRPNFATGSVSSLMWQRSYQPTWDGKWLPFTTVNRTISDDGLSAQWHMRKDQKFSNGEPVTAHAVAAHWNRMLDPRRNQAFAKYLSMVKEFVVIDDYTFETRYNYPYPPAYLAGRTNSFLGQVMPSDYVEKMGKEVNRKPIGTGPYMITDWKESSTVTLARNPHYWDKSKQYVDKIIFKQIPNMQARMNALKAGDIDVAVSMLEKQAAAAKKEGEFDVLVYPASGAAVTYMNTAKAPMDDIRVRRAMAHAVDRSVVKKVIYAGQREMATDLWGPTSDWQCKDVGYPDYDPEKAKALLKEYGKPVKFTLTTSTTAIGLLAAQLYQSFWQKVGMEVEFRQVQVGPQYIGEVVRGQYDLAFWRIPDLIDPDYQVYTPFFSTSGGNFTKTKNPTIDKSLTAGRRSRDIAKRRQAYCDFMKEMNQHMSVLLGGRTTYFVIARKGVMNLPMMHQGYFRAAEVWLND